ncbi:AAA family ATPase [Salipiger sp. PrR002]|uniref:AAA family ATPase n=1 Tax=Salipiger sp. PrR002 TaxID=2706489 RepID=UPI0013B62E18|nr:AAA family ATPase [Salipiger sp. PrR002]NDW02622.1 AAA family ATPase [Salipiger sp. PrR002]NDW59854.1 AAA family ATPase [Salipiger sp. PrR004]
MATIPFIHSTFFPAEQTADYLEKRLIKNLRTLRGRVVDHYRCGGELPEDETDASLEARITYHDKIKVQNRVKKLVKRRQEMSGMRHLTSDDRDRLTALAGGVRLAEVPTEHRADEIAAALHEEMPWMGPATEYVWRAMRRSVREGDKGLRLPPILLNGPPGIGKSFWARRLGSILTVPTTVIEATNENASFGIVGSQRGWGGAAPGRLISTILMERVGNPVVVVDEVEKSGTAKSMSGRAFGLSEALLPLLEPMTARSWSCPFYQVKFDMSWVIWVLTSNNCRALPEPLLSRCPPLTMRALTTDELVTFIWREGRNQGTSDVALDAAVEAFIRSDQKGQPSLRTATRVLQRAADLESHPTRH